MLQGLLLLDETGIGLVDFIFILLKTLAKFPFSLFIESNTVFRHGDGILLIGKSLPQSGKFGIESLRLVASVDHRSFVLRHLDLNDIALLFQGIQ